jgi:hypothetical protein
MSFSSLPNAGGKFQEILFFRGDLARIGHPGETRRYGAVSAAAIFRRHASVSADMPRAA